MTQRICLIGGIYPPDAGGPAKFTQEYENFLVGIKKTVATLVLCQGKSSLEVLPHLTRIRVTRDSSLTTRLLRFIRSLKSFDRPGTSLLVTGAFLEVLFANFTKVNRIVMKIPGDIVWERARNSGKTSLDIFEFQESDLHLRFKLMRFLFTRSLKRADKIIVPSELLRRLTVVWGLDQSKVETIYNSVKIDDYGMNQVSDGKNKVVDVLTVCRLTEWKGVDELIAAVSKLDMSLMVIGDGPERAKLEKLATNLGARVQFLGEISAAEVSRHYHFARRFVLNSKYEGLPHVLLEARASRLLCLAREGTGSSEVITHLHDGILFGEESGMNLVEALKYADTLGLEEENFVNRSYLDVTKRFNQENNYERILRVLVDE